MYHTSGYDAILDRYELDHMLGVDRISMFNINVQHVYKVLGRVCVAIP